MRKIASNKVHWGMPKPEFEIQALSDDERIPCDIPGEYQGNRWADEDLERVQEEVDHG